MQSITELIAGYLSRITLPMIGLNDIVEILLMSFFVYQFMTWIKTTRAYSLLKGILIVLLFLVVAYIFSLNTILYVFRNLANVLIIGVIIIFQPELRKILEELGKKKFFVGLLPDDFTKSTEEGLSDKTIQEMVRGCFDMSVSKIGALIVIEQEILLDDVEKTGIHMDSSITSQLLVNIFWKNTPLHDGAVLIRKNRICAATCYLPLSENASLPKQFGTRHRAALGVSENSDSVTIIVSEETGDVSVAQNGLLTKCRNASELKGILERSQRRGGGQETLNIRNLLNGTSDRATVWATLKRKVKHEQGDTRKKEKQNKEK